MSADIRGQIAAYKADRTALINLPISRAECDAALLAWCNEQAASVHDNVHHFVTGVAYGSPLTGLLQLRASQIGTVDLGPWFAALLTPPVLARALGKHLAEIPKGLTAAERAAALADIDAKLFDLELQDERAVVASELAGAPIARRHDADPRAVLWLDPDAEPTAVDRAPPRPAPEPEQAPRAPNWVESPYMQRAEP